jgi:hypothetical protein
MRTLDQQITDVFSLLGLLLVFVIGYYSALLPQADQLLATTRPDARDDRLRLAARLSSYRTLATGLIVLIALVVALLWPLTRRVISAWTFDEPFPTMRAGLLLVDLILLVMAVAAIRLVLRLWSRGRELRAP